MNATLKTNRILNIVLWIAQFLLAMPYGLFGFMKATQPLDKVALMMKWVPDFSPLFVRSLGVVEILGAIGLILPALTRIQPRLTVLAALCIVLHQICAIGLHVSRGEFNQLGLNAALIALAAFIFWGRFKRAVITPRV